MPMPAGAGVGGRCARPICGGRGCAGCAQYGGVVRMDDGAVTFKGGTISNTWAGVRVHALRSHVANARTLALHVAHDAACHAVSVWRFEQGVRGMRAATCCNVLYVARCVMWHAGVVHCAVQPLCGAERRNGCCALYALCYRLSATRVERQRLPLCTLRVVCCM